MTDARTRLKGASDPSPEARQKRAEENLARAEQQRIDSARAYAEYEAQAAHQDANMARLRALRLAREEAERAAAATPSSDAKDRPAADGGARGRVAPAKTAAPRRKVATKSSVSKGAVAGAASPAPKPKQR